MASQRETNQHFDILCTQRYFDRKLRTFTFILKKAETKLQAVTKTQSSYSVIYILMLLQIDSYFQLFCKYYLTHVNFSATESEKKSACNIVFANEMNCHAIF